MHVDDIKKLFIEDIEFDSDNKYKLSCVLTSPSDNHFICFINHLIIKNPHKDLKINTNYYYDDLLFGGKAQILMIKIFYLLILKIQLFLIFVYIKKD